MAVKIKVNDSCLIYKNAFYKTAIKNVRICWKLYCSINDNWNIKIQNEHIFLEYKTHVEWSDFMKLCFVNLIYYKKKVLLFRGSSYFKIGLYKSKNHRKVKVQIYELLRKYPFAVLCTSAFLKLIINHNITYFI